MNDPVIVRTFTARAEAEIARGLLESEGIAAMVTADDLAAEGPGMTFGKPVDLVVEATDADRAREILEQATLDPAPEEE